MSGGGQADLEGINCTDNVAAGGGGCLFSAGRASIRATTLMMRNRADNGGCICEPDDHVAVTGYLAIDPARGEVLCREKRFGRLPAVLHFFALFDLECKVLTRRVVRSGHCRCRGLVCDVRAPGQVKAQRQTGAFGRRGD